MIMVKEVAMTISAIGAIGSTDTSIDGQIAQLRRQERQLNRQLIELATTGAGDESAKAKQQLLEAQIQMIELRIAQLEARRADAASTAAASATRADTSTAAAATSASQAVQPAGGGHLDVDL